MVEDILVSLAFASIVATSVEEGSRLADTQAFILEVVAASSADSASFTSIAIVVASSASVAVVVASFASVGLATTWAQVLPSSFLQGASYQELTSWAAVAIDLSVEDPQEPVKQLSEVIPSTPWAVHRFWVITYL